MSRLASERYEEIKVEVTDFIEDYGITSYPFDMFELLDQLHITAVPYSKLPHKVRDIFESIVPDAITLFPSNASPIIYYNDIYKSPERIRFTLAHELGHLVLGHPDCWDEVFETEADNFANYLLAPAPLVIRMSDASPEAIASVFDLSLSCSQVVFDRTVNRINHSSKKLTEYEKRIIQACIGDEEGDEIV